MPRKRNSKRIIDFRRQSSVPHKPGKNYKGLTPKQRRRATKKGLFR